jgi:hypothetical protein
MILALGAAFLIPYEGFSQNAQASTAGKRGSTTSKAHSSIKRSGERGHSDRGKGVVKFRSSRFDNGSFDSRHGGKSFKDHDRSGFDGRGSGMREFGDMDSRHRFDRKDFDRRSRFAFDKKGYHVPGEGISRQREKGFFDPEFDSKKRDFDSRDRDFDSRNRDFDSRDRFNRRDFDHRRSKFDDKDYFVPGGGIAMQREKGFFDPEFDSRDRFKNRDFDDHKRFKHPFEPGENLRDRDRDRDRDFESVPLRPGERTIWDSEDEM